MIFQFAPRVSGAFSFCHKSERNKRVVLPIPPNRILGVDIFRLEWYDMQVAARTKRFGKAATPAVTGVGGIWKGFWKAPPSKENFQKPLDKRETLW